MNKNECLGKLEKCNTLMEAFETLKEHKFELLRRSPLSKKMTEFDFKDSEGNHIELLSTKQHPKDFTSQAYDATHSQCMLDTGMLHESINLK